MWGYGEFISKVMRCYYYVNTQYTPLFQALYTTTSQALYYCYHQLLPGTQNRAPGPGRAGPDIGEGLPDYVINTMLHQTLGRHKININININAPFKLLMHSSYSFSLLLLLCLSEFLLLNALNLFCRMISMYFILRTPSRATLGPWGAPTSRGWTLPCMTWAA